MIERSALKAISAKARAMQKILELIQAAANKEYRLVRGRTKAKAAQEKTVLLFSCRNSIIETGRKGNNTTWQGINGI